MNVWIRKTRKRVQCRYCDKYIEVGQYQVVCQYFMKLKHSGKTWVKKMFFHAREPNCWLDRAIAELETRQVVETRGRKRNAISDENREIREKILRRRASVMQRLRMTMELQGGGEVAGKIKAGKIAHLTEMLEQFVVEIEPHGGVPKGWD